MSQPTKEKAHKANVIYRGTLTIEKLKELCYEHLEIKSDADEYSAKHNHNTISIVKQEDGNWKGYMQRNGVLQEVRELSPEYALQRLMTHE